MATLKTSLFNRSGFTLIEIIVGIVVSAILAVILSQIVSGMSQRSYQPVRQIEEKLVLQEVLNAISAEHRRLLMNSRAPLSDLQTYLARLNGTFSGRVTTSLECIEFDPGTRVEQTRAACDGAAKIWKVTLRSTGGQRRTALFTQ